MDNYDVTFYDLGEKIFNTMVKAKKQINAVIKANNEMKMKTGSEEYTKIEVRYIPKHML